MKLNENNLGLGLGVNFGIVLEIKMKDWFKYF